MAGGIGIMVRRVARLASLMVGVMIFLWVLMLHIPRAIVDPYTNVGNEWASVFEALAFSGMAFMLAGAALGCVEGDRKLDGAMRRHHVARL